MKSELNEWGTNTMVAKQRWIANESETNERKATEKISFFPRLRQFFARF